MQQRRIDVWVYWILAGGLSLCIGASAPADANVSARSGDVAAKTVARVTVAVPPAAAASSAAETAEAASSAEPSGEPLGYEQVGIASWYGGHHQGRLTASGERFDEAKLTAAHRSLPLDTKARITNLENGRSIEVTVNDRGPYVEGRVIDLSTRAARALGMTKDGLALVRIEVVADEGDVSTMN
jgi:peptidoglycan lytic transglycosylase